MTNQIISIIIRTMPGREHFLDKCLFILSGQEYQKIEPIIVTQCHTQSDSTEKIEAIIQKWKYYFEDIIFLHHISETDARSRSLNMGINAANGRYLAFLDDDDKVYPHHYKQLIEALQKSQFAWAYSDVVRAEYNLSNQLISRTFPWKKCRYSFCEHLQDNFIPIHSFTIDTERAHDIGLINENFSKLEDYEFLLRLAYKYEPLYISDFSAEYCIRSDGSNTVVTNTMTSHETIQKEREWEISRIELLKFKFEKLGWWVKEIIYNPSFPTPFQQTETFQYNQSSQINDNAKTLLSAIYRSYTWKIIRFGKKINWFFRRRAKKGDVVPYDINQVQTTLLKIVFSPIWLLFGPIYYFEQLMRKLLHRN